VIVNIICLVLGIITIGGIWYKFRNESVWGKLCLTCIMLFFLWLSWVLIQGTPSMEQIHTVEQQKDPSIIFLVH